MRPSALSPFQICAGLGLSACVTPARMHSEQQLNTVATGCGLALGELVQDEEQENRLLAIRNAPLAAQRACVVRWAKRNGLRPVVVNMDFQS